MSWREAPSTPWEQCYAYFGRDDAKFDEEIACLRLAFYLAHFGMFRASGKTRNLHLGDFARIARSCRKYMNLRDNNPKFLEENLDRVESFLQDLKKELVNLDVSPTDTLVSKIALGTTACMPAYDRFAKLALKELGIVSTPSKRGLSGIYRLRQKDLAHYKIDSTKNLPFMRTLDLYLLKKGKEIHASNRGEPILSSKQ